MRLLYRRTAEPQNRRTAGPQDRRTAGPQGLGDWIRATVCLLASLAVIGCVNSEPNPTTSEPVAETQQEFSSFGIERVIPLRIVEVTNDCHIQPVIDDVYATPPPGGPGVQPDPNWNVCSPCSDDAPNCMATQTCNCGPDTVSFDAIKQAVERANFALRAVKVQVYVSRIEKYAMPTFYTTCNPPQICPKKYWNAVSADLRKVFPNATDDSGQPFTEIAWITRAKQSSGDPTRIDVLVNHYNNGGEGRRAWEGPATLTCDSWLFDRPQALAHEIGHMIGLEHPMEPEQTRVRDPRVPGGRAAARPRVRRQSEYEGSSSIPA
jgi:hypothetical protein